LNQRLAKRPIEYDTGFMLLPGKFMIKFLARADPACISIRDASEERATVCRCQKGMKRKMLIQ